MDFTVSSDIRQLAKIKVFGVGGAGGNAVQHMIINKLENVEFICANTDAQALHGSSAEHKIQLGPQLTKGLGAGAKPEIGQKAAEESMQEISKHLNDTEMIFVTAGMGGGTGTGAAPVIARMAKEKGILTVGVVTKPFSVEGKRVSVAGAGIDEIRQHVNCLIIVPNDRLKAIAPKKASIKDMLYKANDVLLSAVRGVTDVITKPGFVNLDFADITTAMSKQGSALMGEGIASGENRALEAAKQAIHSPLLEDISIAGAKALLINITGPNVSMDEYFEIGDYIKNASVVDDELPDIFIGVVDTDDDDDEIRITVIATGIEPNKAPVQKSNVITFNPIEKIEKVESVESQTKHDMTAQNQQNNAEKTTVNNNSTSTSQGMNYVQNRGQLNGQQRGQQNGMENFANGQQNIHIQNQPYYSSENYDSTMFNRSRHTPGAEEFTFDTDDDIPTFIRKQAN